MYTFNGTYRDLACPFEANGRWAIQSTIVRHLKSADYTVIDPVTITRTESGAVVQWIWSGTYDGEPFTLEPSTTFEVVDGLILTSTDS